MDTQTSTGRFILSMPLDGYAALTLDGDIHAARYYRYPVEVEIIDLDDVRVGRQRELCDRLRRPRSVADRHEAAATMDEDVGIRRRNVLPPVDAPAAWMVTDVAAPSTKRRNLRLPSLLSFCAASSRRATAHHYRRSARECRGTRAIPPEPRVPAVVGFAGAEFVAA